MRPRRTILAMFALGVALAIPAGAAEQQRRDVRLVIHPAAEPRPALKYQLLPPLLERRSGNAALHYCKWPHERTAMLGDTKLWMNIVKWIDTPLDELRNEKQVPDWLAAGDSSLFQILQRGARCESVDWDLPIREQEFWSILLPDVQSMRAAARLLAVRARLQIVAGKKEEALATLRVGYALGRHVGQGQTLVQGLVGVTIVGMMNRQLEDLIQQPGVPNLYWALASFPRPAVDFRLAFEAEAASLDLSYPALRELDRRPINAEECSRILDRILKGIAWTTAEEKLFDPSLIAKRIAEGAPRARKALRDWGRAEDEVRAMPDNQAVLLYTLRVYEEQRDSLFKWFALPYPQAQAGLEKADAALRSTQEIIPLAGTMLPAVSRVKVAESRIDRDLNALQVVEAIRLFGAARGRLPETLAEITEVPVPADTLRGQPFIYQRRGAEAVLESPSPQTAQLTYRIQLAKP